MVAVAIAVTAAANEVAPLSVRKFPTVDLDGLAVTVRFWRSRPDWRGCMNRSARRHIGLRALNVRTATVDRPLSDGPDAWERARGAS